jgi:hypothetical protein
MSVSDPNIHLDSVSDPNIHLDSARPAVSLTANLREETSNQSNGLAESSMVSEITGEALPSMTLVRCSIHSASVSGRSLIR